MMHKAPIYKFYMPAPEARLRTKLRYKLKVGGSYLIREQEPKRAPKIFGALTRHSIPGLWVTTSRPEEIRKKYRLAETAILYLAPERVSGEVTLSPTKLDKAIGTISSYFFGMPRRSVVFVDCFKELVMTNGFKRAMGFLKKMTKLCFRNNSNLIVQIDPSKFTKKQLAAIEKAIAHPRRRKSTNF